MVFVIYIQRCIIPYLREFITSNIFEVIGFRLGLTVNNFLMDKKWDSFFPFFLNIVFFFNL